MIASSTSAKRPMCVACCFDTADVYPHHGCDEEGFFPPEQLAFPSGNLAVVVLVQALGPAGMAR
jgi:hypothetical protein